MSAYKIFILSFIIISGGILIAMCVKQMIEENKRYKAKKERMDKYYKEFQEELKNAKTPTERYLVINKYMTKEDGEALRKDFERVGQYINDSMSMLSESINQTLRKEIKGEI